jgi:hypothetical protein
VEEQKSLEEEIRQKLEDYRDYLYSHRKDYDHHPLKELESLVEPLKDAKYPDENPKGEDTRYLEIKKLLRRKDIV